MVNTEVCVLQMMTKNVGVIVLVMKISPKAGRAHRVNPQSALTLRKSYVPWRHTHYIWVVLYTVLFQRTINEEVTGKTETQRMRTTQSKWRTDK